MLCFQEGTPVLHWAKLAIACLIGHMIAHRQHVSISSRWCPWEMKLILTLARAPKQFFDPQLGMMVISLSIQLNTQDYLLLDCVIMSYWKSPGLQSLGTAFFFLSSSQGIACDIYVGHKYACFYLLIKRVTFSNNEKTPLHAQCTSDIFPLGQMKQFPFFVSPSMVD